MTKLAKAAARSAPATRNPSTRSALQKALEGVKIPQHIAIIMDGNGRWAISKNMPRVKGHEAGVASVDEITETCAKIGVKQLTLYAFSAENWRRPREEVEALMEMLTKYLIEKRDKIMKNGIRLTSIGDTSMLPNPAKTELEKMIRLSRPNKRMTLCLALNYSGKNEIINAINRLLSDDNRPKQIDEQTLRKYLYDPSMPEPDLLIRTAGEIRISNFLLWHVSYTELYFTETLWPDFRTPDLIKALKEFSRRTRRYGGLDDYES